MDHILHCRLYRNLPYWSRADCVGNHLNGLTDGFKNLMGDVIQGATGAAASLPAMVIQRANPGLYDMITNGVLQANVAFDKA